MKYLIICFAAGLIIGSLAVYIWNRTHTVGALRIYDEDEMGPSVFLELEKEFPEVRARHHITLRVENVSYYENQNS